MEEKSGTEELPPEERIIKLQELKEEKAREIARMESLLEESLTELEVKVPEPPIILNEPQLEQTVKEAAPPPEEVQDQIQYLAQLPQEELYKRTLAISAQMEAGHPGAMEEGQMLYQAIGKKQKATDQGAYKATPQVQEQGQTAKNMLAHLLGGMYQS